jgi:hypothetical protein
VELTSKVEDEEIGWKNAQQVELQLLGFQKSQFFPNKSKDITRVSVVQEVFPSFVVVVVIVVVTTFSTKDKAQ